MKKKYNLLLSGILLLVVLVFYSFITLAAQDRIIISGLTGDEIMVTVDELKDLPAVEKSVTSVNSEGYENNFDIKGGFLSDLLKKLGSSQRDLKAVRLIAGDGYSIDIPEEILKNRDIILAYEIDGQALVEETKPVRVIIPEERAMYWIKNLTEIKVVDMVKTVETKSIAFLETAISNIDKSDYNYHDKIDKAVKVSDLITALGFESDLRVIQMWASDGLEKDEEKDIFLSGYIKVTGFYTPTFLSPDLPQGMHIKDIFVIKYGSGAICSLEEAIKVLKPVTIQEQTGIKLAELIDRVGLIKATQYQLIALDGYTVEVTAKDLEQGIVYIDEKGRVKSLFAELPGNYSVKYLYTIKPVN